MTIIVVSGLPLKWDSKVLVRKLIKPINGKYEVLAVRNLKKNTRLGYVRLSGMLDPNIVVQRINNTLFGKIRLHAIKPDVEPDLPRNVKPVPIPYSLRRAYRIRNEESIGQVLHAAHTEIMEELQSKHAGLYKLSMRSGHDLLAALSKKVLGHLRWIMIKGNDVETSFNLTKEYRNLHPHHSDFNLIMSTLNEIEREAGRPVTVLNKTDLLTPTDRPYVLSNVPLDRVQVICTKYSKRISGQFQNHIKHLSTDINDQPTDEELAVQKVRLEMKKIIPYIPMMLQTVVKNNILQKKSMYYRVRIYGEPFLPSKTNLLTFLKKFLAVRIHRSDRMFNLLFCKVPLTTMPKMVEADGSDVCGTTLIVRLSDVDYYKEPSALVAEMLSFKGAVAPTSHAHTALDGEHLMYPTN